MRIVDIPSARAKYVLAPMLKAGTKACFTLIRCAGLPRLEGSTLCLSAKALGRRRRSLSLRLSSHLHVFLVTMAATARSAQSCSSSTDLVIFRPLLQLLEYEERSFEAFPPTSSRLAPPAASLQLPAAHLTASSRACKRSQTLYQLKYLHASDFGLKWCTFRYPTARRTKASRLRAIYIPINLLNNNDRALHGVQLRTP
jgi:hypothetical protein